MVAWYLRRAVPWTALLGCLALAAALVALVHRWEVLAGLVLPLVCLLAVAGAAFTFDEPCVTVTTVTPRGGRWSTSARGLVGLGSLGSGVALLVAAPGATDTRGWALVVGALGAVAMLAALVATRRQLASSGAAIATTTVLLGVSPLVVAMFLDLGSPYPLPELSDGVELLWTLVLVGGWLLVLVVAGTETTISWRRARAPRRAPG